MKNIELYSKIGLFNLNPTIDIYEDKLLIDKQKTNVPNLVNDLFRLTNGEYKDRVSAIHLFGVNNFLSKAYIELKSIFDMKDIKIFINEGK